MYALDVSHYHHMYLLRTFFAGCNPVHILAVIPHATRTEFFEEDLLHPVIVWGILVFQAVHVPLVLSQALGGRASSEAVPHEIRYV